MRIGLIDVDGHNFPNLALMKLSAWHKAQGDTVEWWYTDLVHYDIVYMSKVFSDSYSQDVPEPLNADKVVKGGTGYAISLVNGLEVYDKSKDCRGGATTNLFSNHARSLKITDNSERRIPMKKLYLFLNKHMHTLAVIWAACLLPVAVAPAFGWVVVGCIAALCILMFIGDYPKNWIQEV